MNYTEIGLRLRALRMSAALRLEDLSRALGKSPSAMSHYEQGRRKISLPEAELWAEACGHRLALEFVPTTGVAVDAGPLSDYERRLVHAVRELPEDTHRELVLSLARALPGHDVAREGVARQVDLLASLSPAAVGLVAVHEG